MERVVLFATLAVAFAAGSAVVELDDSNFADKMETFDLTLVKFYAPRQVLSLSFYPLWTLFTSFPIIYKHDHVISITIHVSCEIETMTSVSYWAVCE